MRGDGFKMAALVAAGAFVGAGLVLAGARAAQPAAVPPAPVRVVVVLPPREPEASATGDDASARRGAEADRVPTAPVPAASALQRVASAVRTSLAASARPERVAASLRGSVAAAVQRQRAASAPQAPVLAAKPERAANVRHGPKGAAAKPERLAKAVRAPSSTPATAARTAGQPGRRLSPEVVARLRTPKGAHSEQVRRLLERAGRLLERGARWDAMALYARVLQAHPGDADALMGVALCRFELGDRKTARRLLDRLLARAPSHGPAAILRGFLEQLARRPAAAVSWYRQALEHLDDDAALAEELRQVVAALGGDARPSLAEAR